MGSAAFFDLDKTVIARSSVLAFAVPLYRARLLRRRDVGRGAAAQFRFSSARADHALMEQLRRRLSATITGWPAAELRAVITEHLDHVLAPLIYPEAVELVAAHRAAGRLLVLVTSTGEDMAVPVGALLGMDHVLSTRMVELEGRYTGEIADYMYGERKGAAIAELAGHRDLDLADCYAYSDSITDLPMLQLVGHPCAVNPDRALRTVARARGWTVLDFSNAPILRRERSRRARVVSGLAVVAVAVAGVAAHRRARHQRLPAN